MMYKTKVIVCSEIHTKHIYAMLSACKSFNKPGGTYINRLALKC